MAQLKDTLVSGSLRATDSLLSVTAQFKILEAPTASNGDTYGPGTNGHILISNGTSAYWGTTTAITQVGIITSGTWQGTTISTAYGGTGNNTGFTQWGIIYANPATKLVSTSAGSSGYLLQGNGSAAPTWIQATNASTANTIVKRDGSCNFSAGTITATLNGNASTASALQHTTLDSTSINSTTASSFAFSGSGEPWGGSDWVGLQIGDTKDKFQIAAQNNTLVFRQNDTSNGPETGWSDWATMIHSANYTSYVQKIGTANVGNESRPIYLAAGVPTQTTWYHNSCTIYGGNMANYPWHRFAYCTTSADTYKDRDVIIVIRQRYNGGRYGIIKLSTRTSAAGTAKSVSATWICRVGYDVGDVVIKNPTETTGVDETISAYIKCGTYPRAIAYILEGSNYGWTLVSSNEPSDTTASDKKGGTEINASVSGCSDATDGATVSHANSAATATKLATACTLWGNSFDGTANITGAITITRPTVVIGTTSNNGNTGSGSLYQGISIVDSTGYWYGQFYTAADTNGRTRTYINSKNKKTDGTEVSNAFQVGVNKDGTCYYSVSDSAAFRAAIGAGTSSLELGTSASTAAKGNHTHSLTIAEDSGTNALTLAASTKYKLTAGGSTFIFTTPPNTWTALSTSAAGYVAKAPNDTTKFLRGDAKWEALPAASSSVAGITKVGASGGAAAYSHTHSYLPLTGGTLVGTGTSTDEQWVTLTMGNSTASGTAGNYSGRIRLYSNLAYYQELRSARSTLTASRVVYLPARNANCTLVDTVGTGVDASSFRTAISAMSSSTVVNQVSQGKTEATTWRKIVLSGGDAYAAFDTAVRDTANAVVYVAKAVSVQPSTGSIKATKVYNAVWNDYAECRQVETEEPGYCVTETSSGKMIKTYKRLQPGCKITSDTFGTCMGETETAKTPIAVAGRVLAYTYRSKDKYHLGAAVCSAPNGTIDIMSRAEIMMYPERIVGTVSEIPTYDVWHGGSEEGPTNIQVNGRIWIYVR